MRDAHYRFVTAALLAGCLFPTAPADARDVGVLPVARWRVVVAEGDKAELIAKDGCLGVRFEARTNRPHRSGHVVSPQATIRLLLREPVKFAGDESRVFFDALGTHASRHDRTLGTPVDVRAFPLLRDAKGELLIYEPWPVAQVGAGRPDTWGRWASRYMLSSEAGGATQEIFEAEGGDENAWPDGAVELAGFDIRVRAGKDVRVSREIFLGAIQLAPMRPPPGAPFAFADALLSKAGTYSLAASVSEGFQQMPVSEFGKTIKFDPEDLQSRRRKIEFPLGPAGSYWVSYRITDAEGKLVAGSSFRQESDYPPADVKRKPIRPTDPPLLGCLRVNPETRAGGVYERDEPMTLNVRVFGKGDEKLELKWRVQRYAYEETIDEGASEVAFDGKPYVDVPVTVKPEPGRDCYRVALTVLRDGESVDRAEYFAGRKSDLSKPYDARPGRRRTRDVVKQAAYFRVTFMTRSRAKNEQDEQRHFRLFCRQVAQMTRDVCYSIDLRDFEVLPGCFDLAPLDRIMDIAADEGCYVNFRIQHEDRAGRNHFRWHPFHRQRNFDNAIAAGHHWYGSYSLTDRRYVDAWLRAFRALHDRYREHRAFQGYYVMNIGGEWAVLDQPWRGLCAGYEAPTVQAFRAYLRDRQGLSLAQLNQRWGTDYADWSEVKPPLPDYTTGRKPDLRVRWLDFCRYKAWLDRSYWYQTAAANIRSFDPDSVVIIYSFKPDGLIGLADYLHNGGNHFLQGIGSLIPAAEGGLGWIQEPHHPQCWAAYGAPAGGGWVLDWTIYVATAQSGGGGANLHIYFNPRHEYREDHLLAAHYGNVFAFDRFEKYKPILNELRTAKVVGGGSEIAELRDPSTLYSKHRTTFSDRWGDLSRWFELLQHDAVPAEPFREDHADGYKLLLPNVLDEVMTQANIERIGKLVRHGAKAVLCANTGRYCPELGDRQYALLRQLGIAPPRGEYKLTGLDVTADVATGSPLLEKGSKLRFFTTEQFRLDLASEDLRTRFLRWPYRWLPVTDYFGYYPAHKATDGKVLARFASGGAAVSLHKVGEGEVLVFWGTPDFQPRHLGGFMARAAQWAGASAPHAGGPIPYLLELRSEKLARNYAMLYHETPGTYRVKLPATPDGAWFLDELVCDRKLGVYTGKELREKGIEIEYSEGSSPLKLIRMLGKGEMPHWARQYRAAE